jgi:predicted DCC family thiol-disulfide oxidoreductase YuxK
MKAPVILKVIYDGQCRFCLRALRVLRALDLKGSLRFFDSHQPETIERFPELRTADIEDAMYAVVEGEPTYRGFFAFRRIIWSSYLTWALIPLFYFPGAGYFGPRVYTWVARNRSKLGCRSEVCELSPSLHNEATKR